MAPTEGKIKYINVTTIVGAVKPGEDSMQILPTSRYLVIDAKVSPADIAYVKEGQEATVKLDAYDYSIFGAMEVRSAISALIRSWSKPQKGKSLTIAY